MEKTVWWHWQNLSKGLLPWHGRGWLHFPKGEFNWEWNIGLPGFRIHFGLDNDCERTVSFSIGVIFISLHLSLGHWMINRLIKHPGNFDFYWFENALWFGLWTPRWECRPDHPWWQKTHAFHMPWKWDHYRSSYLLKDGTWAHDIANKRKVTGLEWLRWKESLPMLEEIHPYTYVRNNGEIQNTKATCTVDEMEWRWRWFMWCPLFRKVRKSINFDFSEPIGERVNTWKGGVYGSGYEMNPGESIEQCLRRMEKERLFD